MSAPTNKVSKQPQQQPQQEQQKGPHPSVLLHELHEMVRMQASQLDAIGSRNDEAIKLQSAILDDVLSMLHDLNSAVQTLLITVKTTRQVEHVEPQEDEEDQEASEDLADEAGESTSEETPDEDEDGMWDEEEFEPDPAARPPRRAAQPAQQTQTQAYDEGPRPLPLPYSQASQLRRRPGTDQRGGRN